MTGLLIFSMVETRFDIVFTTLLIPRLTKNLSRQNTETVKSAMCYLEAIKTLEITYKNDKNSGNLIIKDYFDFNWDFDQITKKLICVFIFMLNSSLVN